MKLSEEEFEDLIAEALDDVPPVFAEYLERVVVDVESMPDAETVRRLNLRDARTLLGLFHGVPLTRQHVDAPPLMPNRVVIYQDNIQRFCRTRREMVRQVRKTVLHEIGHHFGMDEDQLADLGYG
jgi:predicted Zn-dependent protease with MMP-like domain